MKIEKMNDHQIRCTLTREDLAMRQIKLSELAYGSEKAKTLFRDMMQQAANDFGFEADDIPLMIEAIPLSPEKIMLIITKVEAPDELDTRFSNFTQMDEEEGDFDTPADNSASIDVSDITTDLLDLFSRLKAEQNSAKNTQPEKPQAPPAEITRLFSFQELDDAITAAHALHGFYTGKNTLYKNQQDGIYYLILNQSKHTLSDFNKVNNVVSAYLSPRKFTPGMQAYFEEHLKVIAADSALQSLAEL